MAYNVCVNCGTNLNHILGVYEKEMEKYRITIINDENMTQDEKDTRIKYFNNLFFIKYNIDRICCRTFFISFLDYVPSNI